MVNVDVDPRELVDTRVVGLPYDRHRTDQLAPTPFTSSATSPIPRFIVAVYLEKATTDVSPGALARAASSSAFPRCEAAARTECRYAAPRAPSRTPRPDGRRSCPPSPPALFVSSSSRCDGRRNARPDSGAGRICGQLRRAVSRGGGSCPGRTAARRRRSPG